MKPKMPLSCVNVPKSAKGAGRSGAITTEHSVVVIEQRAPTDPFVGYGHWIQVGKPMSLLEAATFLNNAHADPTNVSHGVDVYVDPHNIEYRLKGVLH